MSKYGICYIGSIDRGNATKTHAVVRYSDGMFFRGYDFMGSANWAEKYSLEEAMTEDEAKQIVSDLEAADEPEDDPVIKSLQTTMDYAWNRREDEHNALEHIRENGPEFMLNKQYAEYRASQAFYEGICMAIFAAGYQIITDHETGKSTVCK